MAAERDVRLVEGQRTPLGDLKLQPHAIDAGHAFGHRMLDLDAGVHLQEIEPAVACKKELDRSRSDIAHRRGRLDRRRAHFRAQPWRHGRRRRFLDQLLVAALDRAVALAEMNDLPRLVAEHLDLDVARADERPLEDEPAIAESRLRLGARGAERGLELALRMNEPQAASAAAGACLHHHRIADALGLLGEARRTLLVAVIAGGAGHPRRLHQELGRRLVAHGPDRRGRRPDEDEARGCAGLGEGRAFGEEAVTGVNRLGAAAFAAAISVPIER